MIIISLGFNCSPAIIRKNNFNQSKNRGYQTCPFDLCVTPMKGLCDCIEEDFGNFFDLRFEGGVIMNSYNMWFNHESPLNHKIYKELGPDTFFMDNNYEKFMERYQKRIDNFRNYMKSGDDILFLLNNPHDKVDRLIQILCDRYPECNFQLAVISDPTYENGLFYKHFGITSEQYEEYLHSKITYFKKNPVAELQNHQFSFDSNNSDVDK